MQVYLIKMGKFYKIGRSKHPERRLSQIRAVKMPDQTDVELVHSVETERPSRLEWYLHKRFADFKVNGEWFKFTPKGVREIVEAMDEGYQPELIEADFSEGTVSLTDAARILGVSRQAVHQAVRDGRLPAVTVSKPVLMITQESLDSWTPNPNMKRAGRKPATSNRSGRNSRGGSK